MNTLNKVITWNPLREMEQATQNRFNPFFLSGFPNRMVSGEIHSLAVADWSPEVDISEDDRGYLLKADHGGVPRRSAESASPDNADSKIKSYRS
jgi:hypothetical protein